MMSSGRTETSYTNSGHASAIELLRSPDGFADHATRPAPVPRAVLPCCCSDAAPPPHTVLAATPLSRMDLPWWRARFEAKQEELRTHHIDLMFLGNSITQDYEVSGPPEWRDFAPVWQRFYGDRNAINLGYNGDTTAHLLWRIENGEVAGIAPKVAVILIGANNLGRVHWSADDTVAGIDAIVDATAPPTAAYQAAAARASCRPIAPPGPPRRRWRSTARWRSATAAAATSPTSISADVSCRPADWTAICSSILG